MKSGDLADRDPILWVAPIATFETPPFPLTNDERAYCDRFRREDDRLARVAVRMLAKHAAHCWEVNDEIVHDENGAPSFKDVDVHLSLAHSRSVVAVALADSPIGIDVETVSRRVDFEQIAKRFFSDAEWDSVQRSAEPRSTFFELWTQKEAVLKAERIGLAIPLKDVNFEEGRATTHDYQMTLKAMDEWIAAVAFQSEVTIQTFDWSVI